MKRATITLAVAFALIVASSYGTYHYTMAHTVITVYADGTMIADLPVLGSTLSYCIAE